MSMSHFSGAPRLFTQARFRPRHAGENESPSPKHDPPAAKGVALVPMFRIFLGSILALPGLLFAVVGVRAADPPLFDLEWGSYGTADGQIAEPRSLAVAPDGTVYV